VTSLEELFSMFFDLFDDVISCESGS
jgi:hypothetical protein